MGGAQGKVSDTAKRSEAANTTLKNFAKNRENDAEEYKDEFQKKITEELLRAGINDQTFPIALGIQHQTEYASEFNVDKLADVVTSALKSVQAATGDDGKVTMETATSDDAMESYVQLVGSIAASLKSSSSSASNFTFQMTKIGPGMFAFISARAANLTDEKLFGSEAVSCSTFVYTFARSIQDIENTTGYQVAVANSTTEFLFRTQTMINSAKAAQESITLFKQAQVDNVADFTSGKKEFAAYNELDDKFQFAIDKAMDKQLAHFSKDTNVTLLVHSLDESNSRMIRTIKLQAGRMKGASRVTFLQSVSRGEFSVDDSSSSSADLKEGLDKALTKVMEREATGLKATPGLKAMPALEKTLHSRASGFSHRTATSPDESGTVSYSMNGASFSVSGSQFELSLKVDNGASVSVAPGPANATQATMLKTGFGFGPLRVDW